MADQFTTILDMNLTTGVTAATSTGPSAPGAPGTLSLAAGSPSYTAINLSWSVPSNTGNSAITGYRIKKDGVVLVANTSSTGTTYSATGLTNNTAYNFTVAAINAYGTGPDGNTISLTTGAFTVPGAPTSLTAVAAGSTVIDLSWTAPAVTGGQSITGYKIEISTNSGGSWSTEVANTGTTATTYSDTSLTADTRYDYRVAAINPVGTGAYSNEAYSTTPDPPFALWGGIINQYTVSSTTWRSHTFRGSGILETTGSGSVSAQWFILGAGGDGIQGGGGAGGVRQYDKSGEAGAITLNGGTDYTVTVGVTAGKDYANSGGDSVFSGSDITDITALGGGKGGAGAGSAGGAPTDGGSGGGGGASSANTPQPGQGSDGSPLQGRDGGAGNGSVSGGGGGGYGSVGQANGGYGTQGGNGGTGGTLMSFGAVTAHSTAVYAGGGGGIGIGGVEGQGGSDVGGDAIYTSSPAFSGVANTGSGGGSHYGQASAGGFGSAGIVIIRYVVA